jgi:hypothetical protein
LPKGKAIDSFIGLSSMIGRRHGEAYLHLPAELLCAKGAPSSPSIRTSTIVAPGALVKRPGFAS